MPKAGLCARAIGAARARSGQARGAVDATLGRAMKNGAEEAPSSWVAVDQDDDFGRVSAEPDGRLPWLPWPPP